MASRGDSAGSFRPRSRRSIAHVPRSRLTSTIDKENSTTDIGAIQPPDNTAKTAGKDKKSRSKSLGPGGLDALQNSNGNRRKSTTVFPVKGILKPTVPVSPVQNIPSFEETRKQTPARGSQQNEGNGQEKEGLLIDLDTPARPPDSNAEDTANPFDDFNASSAIAAAREKEEREQRERERKAILEQREARRKSMANRRVSFAPEATLHTWNVVEIPDDSTSSSTSNSTRRASSTPNAERQEEPQDAPQQNDPPSSPFGDADSDIAFSPVQYPDLQELANRPATAGPYEGSHDLSSSPFSGSSADGSDDTGVQSVARDDDDDDDDSTSDAGFDAESTAMSMDDITARTAESASSSSSARLNEALRQAAQEAGTKAPDYEDNDDMPMEMATQEITGAFQPWIKKGERQSFDWDDISAAHDQENIDPSKQSNEDAQEDGADDEEMSMDVTNSIGGILSKQPSRRQSTARRQPSGAETNYDEQTMELTNVVGGIAQPASPAKSIGVDSNADDEEMTMEFTSVVGGVLNKNTSAAEESHTPRGAAPNFADWNNEEDDAEDLDMEMTGALGGILPPIEERTEPQDDDQTAGMDVTAAMGTILPSEAEQIGKDQENQEVDNESDSGQLGSSPFQEQVRQSPAKSPPKSPTKSPRSPAPFTIAAENGSPDLASVRSRRTRQSLGRAPSKTPTPQPSPPEEQTTPSKQPAPQATQSSTPLKTPPSGNGIFQPEHQESGNQPKSPATALFEHNAATGQSTPQFILRPQKRRSSGLGIDKEGLGSPRVAEMLDKRRSIGDEASQFVPQEQPKQGGVRFEDPLKLQEEVDRERKEEENREDGHVPPWQTGERDATSNLKDMISSLTPKKNKLKGRKSLHVGAAKGVLGKRPKELDDSDDEEGSDNTPKRLKGREASPVKNIRLPAHPAKDEAIGRLVFSPPQRLFGSPTKGSTTPIQEPKNVALSPLKDGSGSFNFAAEGPVEEVSKEPEQKFEPIPLQDFLNMTNIHFMELTTTKRRHTTVPGSASRRSSVRRSIEGTSKPATFEDCVAAGFCTVPMLELYQHSCRELKSYISEGRQVIRSIEAETYAENPALFREYMAAPSDIRSIMDNQFRNVKTHARLLSKATWYEWRMKLLEGLKEGLNRHADDMKADDEVLTKHEAVLNGVVPGLVEKHSSLEQEATSLQQLADEMENCDQDELRSARENLASVEDEIASKKQELQELQTEVQEKTDTVEAGTELKAQFMAQIQEAERVKEECRGWSAKEINELKQSVSNIEQQTGWSIISAGASSSGDPSLTMSYRNQLQLSFYPRAFSTGNPSNMPLDLRYAPGASDRKKSTPTPLLTPIASLVLKSLQKHLNSITQSTTAPKHMLRFISQAWDLVLDLEEEARMLEFCGVTKLKLLEVEDAPFLRARCTILGTVSSKVSKIPMKKGQANANGSNGSGNCTRRIDIDFAVKTRISTDGDTIGAMDLETDVLASKVYGFGSGNEVGISEAQMKDILANEIGEKKGEVQLGNGVWSRAVRMLTGTVF